MSVATWIDLNSPSKSTKKISLKSFQFTRMFFIAFKKTKLKSKFLKFTLPEHESIVSPLPVPSCSKNVGHSKYVPSSFWFPYLAKNLHPAHQIPPYLHLSIWQLCWVKTYYITTPSMVYQEPSPIYFLLPPLSEPFRFNGL